MESPQQPNKQLINNLLERAKSLRAGDSTELDALLRDADMHIRRVFGETSDYKRQLKAIHFVPIPTRSIGARVYSERWERGKGKLINLLNTMSNELELFPDKDPGGHPARLKKSQSDVPEIAVIHGRNKKAKDALFRILRELGFKPIEWNQAVKDTGKSAPYIGEIVAKIFDRAACAVVLLTPDDAVQLLEVYRKTKDPDYQSALLQARPNVYFEAGMALSKFPDKTVLIELGDLRPFTDLEGRYVVQLDDSEDKKGELASFVGEATGFPVDEDKARKFEISFESAVSDCLEIVSAIYLPLDREKWHKRKDARAKLQKKVEQGRLHIKVTNENVVGPDPARTIRKVLIVHYKYNGKWGHKLCEEGEYLELP